MRKRDCYRQIVCKRLSVRLGYAKAVWAVAHRLCQLIWKVLHEGARYVERGPTVNALTLKRRKQKACNSVEEARILGSANADHGLGNRPVGFFEGVAGESRCLLPLCRLEALLATETRSTENACLSSASGSFRLLQ